MTQGTRHDGQNTGRGHTAKLWQNCPFAAIEQDFRYGWYMKTDFMKAHDLTNDWTLTQSTTGTFALVTDTAVAQGGVAALDCNSTTVVQGAQIQHVGAAGARFLPNADAEIFFECRYAVADLTAGSTGPEFFAGLAEIDTTIIAASALSTANHVGLSSITDDGVLISAAEKAGAAHTGTTMTSLATAAALANVSWHKFGFHIKGLTSIDFYADGVKKIGSGDKVATANIPAVALAPSFVCQSDGTVDAIVYLDWVKCYQKQLIA